MASFIPLAIMAAGSYLKNRSANKKAEAAAKAQQPYQQRANDKDAARSQLANSIAKAYGIEGSAGAGMLGKLGTPLPATGYSPAGNGSGAFGDILSGIGTGMAANQSSGVSFDDFMEMMNQGGAAGGSPTPVAASSYTPAGVTASPEAAGDANYDPQVGAPVEYDDEDPNSPWYRGPR